MSRMGAVATSLVEVIEIHDPETDDIDFVLACREGDLDAFGELYRRHAPTILRYAWSVTGSRASAEDVLQDTFATAWSKRRRATIVDVSLLPWLLAICKNHLRNEVRRLQRRKTTSLEQAPELPARDIAQFDWVREAMDALTPEDRRVTELCLVHGLTYQQAADLVGSTPTAVGKRLQRARARLRAQLTNDVS
jgi:RNA polymerase sigma factor (sigma-70 family)